MSLARRLLSYAPHVAQRAVARVQRSPLGYRLARGVFWSMAGVVISRAMMLAATVLVARMLGKAAYGELGMIRSTVDMFSIFAGFGLGLTATKHVAEYRKSDPVRAGRIVVLSGVFAALTSTVIGVSLFVFAPWLASHTINAPHLGPLLRVGAIGLFVSALNGAQTGALAGFEAFGTIAVVNLATGIVSLPMLIVGVWLGGLHGAVWATVANLAFNWVLNHFALRQIARRNSVPLRLEGCTAERSVLWRFSLPAVLSGTLVGPVAWVCNSLLVNQPDGYVALGIYTAVFQMSGIMTAVNTMLGRVFLPVCVSMRDVESPKFSYINFVTPWAIGIVGALPLICIPELWAVLFGAEFSGKSMFGTTVFVGFSAVVVAHRQGISRNFVAGSYLWWSLMGNALWGATAIVLMYCFRNYGAPGRAASFAFAYAVNTVLFIPFYIRMRLCPKFVLFSLPSILVWIVIVGSVALMLLLDLGICLRGLVLLASYILIFGAFRSLWLQIIRTPENAVTQSRESVS